MTAAAVRVPRVPRGVRSSNSSANAHAMAVRSVRREVADRSRSGLLSSSGRHNSRRRCRRKPRASGPGGVAAVAAAEIAEKNPRRIRTPARRSSRVHRANRVLPVRHRQRRQRARIPNPERSVPRVKAPNAAAASAVAGGAVVVARKADRRQRKVLAAGLYTVSGEAIGGASAATIGRFIRRWRAVHSAKPSQRMQ